MSNRTEAQGEGALQDKMRAIHDITTLYIMGVLVHVMHM